MMRRLAIEVGSWRCGLIRGAAWPKMVRRPDTFAAEAVSGGKSAAFGNQEAIGGNTKRGMMVKSAPGTALEVVESQLLLEFKKVVLDSPAQLGSPDQLLKRRGGREVGQPILSRFGAARGPLDQQPLLAMRNGTPIIAVGGTYPDGGKARAHHPRRCPHASSPCDRRWAQVAGPVGARPAADGQSRGARAWAAARGLDTEAVPAAHYPRATP
jgi:hypothetical protein